ncbi:MAG: hypothetical protein ACRBI6_05055 [Acidimicrobiales bacterium]
MTDRRNPDDLIEVASAYLDGEASSEEIALVEGDPELQRVVAAMASNRDLVADEPTEIVDPPERGRHLAAALSVFDELYVDASPVAGDEIAGSLDASQAPDDLASIAAAVTGSPRPTSASPSASSEPPTSTTSSVDSSDTSGADVIDLRTRVARRAPAWLAAAAGVMVVVGGVGVLANNNDNADESAEASFDAELDRTSGSPGNAAASSEESSAEEAEDAATADMAEMDDGEESMEALTDTDAADEDLGGADEEAEESGEVVAPVDASGARAFPAGTTVDQLVEATVDGLQPLDTSFCYVSGALDELIVERAPADLIGMAPVQVGDELFELLVFNGDDGALSGELRTPDCALGE